MHSLSRVPFFFHQVLTTFEHADDAFTEGLAVEDGVLYESVGLWGRSKLSAYDLRDHDPDLTLEPSMHVTPLPTILQSISHEASVFGEGIYFLSIG